MKMVFNVGVYRVLKGSILCTNCWVDFVPGIQIGDKVQIGEDVWTIKDTFTGSTKEEVINIKGAVFGTLLDKGSKDEN